VNFRVLDVGCGDGRFVQFAHDAGCDSVGIEVDTIAVARNRARGLNIYEGDTARALQLFGPDSFDWITLSHVIEHVHDPARDFAILHDLLRPNGHLWLETPNPSSFGHQLFGDRWRDLDPPRHLCLMSRHALRNSAANANLALIAEHRRPFVPFETFPFSAAALARDGSRPINAWRLRLKCLAYEIRGMWDAQGREWLTMVFRRSDR
jgi:2-polyprenyl-3-methyl-5-hydroxy-6-metoxy-1,4-benzoquinol methylase